jgi:hypothetical protein
MKNYHFPRTTALWRDCGGVRQLEGHLQPEPMHVLRYVVSVYLMTQLTFLSFVHRGGMANILDPQWLDGRAPAVEAHIGRSEFSAASSLASLGKN